MIASAEKLSKAIIKHGGNQHKAAKELGMSQPSISTRLTRNPELKQKILNAREKAMQRAGMTRSKVYETAVEGLKANVVSSFEGQAIESDAPDYKERRESVKLCLQLFRDLEVDSNQEQKEKPGIAQHLHLHFDKMTAAELTRFLLGRDL